MKDASLNSISRKRVADLTKEIIWAGSYLAAQQYCAALGGNISVRVTRDHLLCTRAQADLGLLRSADILLCDLAGHCSRDDVLPTSELCLHRAAYEEREDVGAVIHAHPPTATAFAVAGVPLDTLMLPEMVVLLGPVALVPYATPGTEELAQRLKLFLPAHDALLMENHGALTVGRDVREAAHHMEREFQNGKLTGPVPVIEPVNREITYRDALKEALIEEMKRDRRVIFYGEDVAEYGGVFKVSKGFLQVFGRERVFNTPISEAAICGTAVGAAMIGLRPVVELMYMDFALMSSDQISNQAAKWHYMSGAQVEVPLVIRASVGGGKGYGGQHSQTLEAVFAHIPGLYVVYPSTPYDAKGMLKSAIRNNNPVMFVEAQSLYSVKGVVPEEEYLVPLGVADVKREGTDISLVAWGPAVPDALKAADKLKAEAGVTAEVVDLRSLVPLDMETVLRSVQKTGRCVVTSQAVNIGSFTGEIASDIQAEAFDYLDAPVLRVGAKNGIAPQSYVLEAVFLPTADDIVAAAKSIL